MASRTPRSAASGPRHRQRPEAGRMVEMTHPERTKLGPILATVIVANAMIGSGIFMLPAGLGAVGSISIMAGVAAGCGAVLVGGVLDMLAIVRPETRGLFS